MFEVLMAKYNAWESQQLAEAEMRTLSSKTRLSQTRAVLAATEAAEYEALEISGRTSSYRIAEAEAAARRRLGEQLYEARRTIAEVTLRAEEAEYSLTLHRQIRSVSPAQAQLILGAEIETERLLAERAALQQRGDTAGALPAGASSRALPSGSSGSGSVDLQLSDREIEALAQRAFMRFADMEPQAAERAFAEWAAECQKRLPAYAAEETIQRVKELREVLR